MGNVSGELSRYPIDAENVEEMDRLTKQAQIITRYVGLYPPEIQPTGARAVLDVGCGPGEWALEVGRGHPDCQVVGMDISHRMVAYANSCSRVHRLANVRFEEGDACQPLPFADNSFDMVHARLVTGFLSTTAWPVFLAECFRVLRPGGIMCNTELENMGNTTSVAFARYNALVVAAMRLGERCFIEEGDQIGILAVQEHLLQDSGFSPVFQKAHVLNFSVGTLAHPPMIDNYAAMMHLIQPALLRSDLIKQEELSILYTKALAEMHANSFYAVLLLQTVWGRKPFN